MNLRLAVVCVVALALVALAWSLFQSGGDQPSGVAVSDPAPAGNGSGERSVRSDPPVPADSTPAFASIEEFRAALDDQPPEPVVYDVAALRSRAMAGDADAAWQMANHVVRCDGRELLSDEQVLANLKADWALEPEPRNDVARRNQEQRRLRQPMYALAQMAELRGLCVQLQDADLDRLMGWLESALAAGQPDLLSGMNVLGGFPLPERTGWRVRHAERIASFMERARAAYEARMAAGDIAFLERAGFFYQNFHVWPDIDPYRVYVHLVLADEIAKERNTFRFGEAGFRQWAEQLDEAEQARAIREGQELYRRCCAGPAGRP